MKQRNTGALACAALSCVIGGNALAQETRGFVNIGVASIRYQSDADITVGGAGVPGAAVHLTDSNTLAAEFGYWLTPRVALRATVGVPPRTRVEGRGTLAPFGRLGEIRYAPAMMTATYRFDVGAVRPYIGAGLAYIHILQSKDGAVANLDVESRFGSVLQAGMDIPIDRSWGLFVDLRKLYWKTEATGTAPAFGGAPVRATLKPSPFVLAIGISRQF